MYPFVRQLLSFDNSKTSTKLGALILDVKGNFHKQVYTYCKELERLDDLITLEVGGSFTYNPLDKPNLKPSVLAYRLKTILKMFSPETSESYWLDKAEQVLCEAIKLCRLYNNGYVTFDELHKLLNNEAYFSEKIDYIKNCFLERKLSESEIYDFSSAFNFFESEFSKLDSRTLSILKSEITRITGSFVSEYDVLKTFCPKKEDISFNGFSDVIKNGKIVVLNMNIAEYKNLSKIIAAYLKLDFQTEVLMNISSNTVVPSAFVCDEYHEYVTDTDASFFAQSREAKVINIVATQSYTSILNSLRNESSTKVIVQNLINKIWYRTDDAFTIEDAQKQIGKEDKTKISKSVSENAEKTNYNYFINSLNSKNSNISESVSTYVNSEYIYDTNFFTRDLETFSALVFLSNGNKILEPQKLKMLPYFFNN